MTQAPQEIWESLHRRHRRALCHAYVGAPVMLGHIGDLRDDGLADYHTSDGGIYYHVTSLGREVAEYGREHS